MRSARVMGSQAIDLDGIAANFRCVMEVERLPLRGYRRALSGVERRLKRGPAQAGLHALKGKLLSNLSRLPEARAALEKALSLKGSDAQARVWLAGVLLLEGQVDRAAGELEGILTAGDDSVRAWAYFYRAACRTISGDSAGAIRDLMRSCERGGGGAVSAAARAMLGLLESKEGRYEKALASVDTAARLLPGRTWPRALRAVVLSRADRPGEALAEFDAALAGEGFPWMRVERSILLEKLGRREEALRDLETLLRRAGPRADLLRRGCALRLELGRVISAKKYFLAALAAGISAKDASSLACRLATALRQAGSGPAAAELLRKTWRSHPGDAELAFALALELDVLGYPAGPWFSRAERLLRRAIAGGRPDLRLALARNLSKQGRLDEAESLLKKIGAASAEFPEASLLLAECLLTRSRALAKEGRLAQAEALARKAMVLAPSREDSILQLADVLMSLKRFAQAEALLRRRRDVDSAPMAAAALRVQCLLRLGRLKGAEAVLGRVRATASASPRDRRPFNDLLQGFLRASLDQAGRLLVQGGTRKALSILRRAQTYCSKNEALGPEGWLSVMTLRFALGHAAEAAQAGERVLVLSRAPEHLSSLASPLPYPEHLEKGLAPSYRKGLLRSLEARPLCSWASYWRALLGEDMAVRSRPARYDWMRARRAMGLLQEEHRFKEAAREFLAAARCSRPADWMSLMHCAEASLCYGDQAAAWRLVREALSVVPRPRRGEALAWKGAFLLWLGRYGGASRACEEARRLGALYALGWKGALLLLKGRPREALEPLSLRIASNYHVTEALVWRAEAHLKLGRRNAALKDARRAISLDGSAGFYAGVLAALARGRRRDMEEAAAGLPARVAQATAAATPRQTLEKLLKFSLGVRRGRHEPSLWLGRL
jgi:tetratricopeptide (TPR) repeat protein